MGAYAIMGMQHEEKEMKYTETGLPGRDCAADGVTCQAPPHQVIHLAGHKKHIVGTLISQGFIFHQ
jgi:hypothetical protein